MRLRNKIPPDERALPLIPIRDQVIFPHTVQPLFIGRANSRKAIENSLNGDRMVVFVFQRNQEKEELGMEQLYDIGTVCYVLQVLRLPDNTMRILVEGRQRVKLLDSYQQHGLPRGTVRDISSEATVSRRCRSLMLTVKESFVNYSKAQKKFPREIVTQVTKAETPDILVGQICSNLKLPVDKKISYLSSVNDEERLEELAVSLEVENEVVSLKQNISGRVRKRLEKNQKEFILNEHLKEIHKELGNKKPQEDPSGAQELEQKLKEKQLDDETRNKANRELKRLKSLQPLSPESGVIRTYLEWITDLPYGVLREESYNIIAARSILDGDHYDLREAKERILDHIAVLRLNREQKGPILCFVGPPGTGKTSLGRSVARALGRDFVRISLGGVRDEAEIRGHRKTYVGALPGKIIQSLKRAGSANPVFLLDEVDKMSSDYRGDPSAALLEVLDPEQNVNFSDHYLELPFDLSRVMFITTANSTEGIPYPLLDRMEIIEVPGYSEYEKVKIASRFILPRQLKENGLPERAISFDNTALRYLINNYTMESGVRNLEREIGAVIRKSVRHEMQREETRPGRDNQPAAAIHLYQNLFFTPPPAPDEQLSLPDFKYRIKSSQINKLLGQPRFDQIRPLSGGNPGLAIGMAYTEVGGRVLPVEVRLVRGSGEIRLTGKLGDVMKESAYLALSFLRSNSEQFALDDNFAAENDIHIHVPEGAVPKDGPSAGITITAALLSAVLAVPLSDDTAMTGEITLTNRLLPVGGIKEKVLAAHRHKLKRILLPELNRKDYDKLPPEIKQDMTFIFFASIDAALRALFPDDVLPAGKQVAPKEIAAGI